LFHLQIFLSVSLLVHWCKGKIVLVLNLFFFEQI